MDEFEERNRSKVFTMRADHQLRALTRDWFQRASEYEYSYHFRWLGLPIIQFPQDIVAVQEVIWTTKPDLIVETGIARGGSLVLSASILELLGGDGLVVGVDIDIREANRSAIESHPLSGRIRMIEGSSVAPDVVAKVNELAAGRERVMVLLDSNHTHEHVLRELQLYSPLVTPGCYLIAFDTVIEDMPAGWFQDRPWDVGDNPATAVRAFLETNDRFQVDDELQSKLLISVAPGGYLRCVKAHK
jgi:cephalosporin hydroxylase